MALRKAMLFFGEWRTYFLSDADERAIHHAAEMKGDIAMRLFWERGTAPTVQAVLDRRMRVERRSPRPLLAKGSEKWVPGVL